MGALSGCLVRVSVGPVLMRGGVDVLLRLSERYESGQGACDGKSGN